MRVLTGRPWAQSVVRWTSLRSLPAVVNALIVHGQPDLSGTVQETYKEKVQVVPAPPEWGERQVERVQVVKTHVGGGGDCSWHRKQNYRVIPRLVPISGLSVLFAFPSLAALFTFGPRQCLVTLATAGREREPADAFCWVIRMFLGASGIIS